MMPFLIAFLVIALVLILMAVGVFFAKKPIKGTCGGISSVTGDSTCQICGGKPVDCTSADEK